jgi:hypothetical protein
VGLCAAASADTVTLITGRSLEGTVLQETKDNVIFQLRYSVTTLPRSAIKAIRKTPATQPATRPTGQRIPPWSEVMRSLVVAPWATGLQPVPATVVEKGHLRHVPYNSYRCGSDYEVNIYGDPERPCGVEVGVYRGLLKDERAKANCIAFVASLMRDRIDAETVRALNTRQDAAERSGLTFEVTPETATDAYGGWWVSVYDVKALDSVRATPKELEEITVVRVQPMAAAGRQARAATRPAYIKEAQDELLDWKPSDLERSRPASSGGGSVYVRGYQRKDGTYVRPHTRSAPSSSGGRRR